MKFARLVLKSARRSKRRTALTILSVAIAVFLFASLRAVLDGFSAVAEASSSTRVVTIRSTSMIFNMPTSHADVIRGIPGVQDVTWANWFGGIYKDPKNFFGQFGIDAESYLRMYPEILVSPGEKRAFLEDRTGALVGDGLVRKYGWHVGDRIVIQPGIPYYGTQDYTFTIPGNGKWTSKASTSGLGPGSFVGSSEFKYVGEENLPQGKAWHAKAKDKDGSPFDGWIRESDGYPLKYTVTQDNNALALTFDKYNTGVSVSAPPTSQVVQG